MKKILLASLIVIVAIWALPGRGAPQDDNVRTLMKLKLSHAHDALDGIALEDFAKIEKAASGLAIVSQAAGWQVLQTPEYTRQSAEFRRTADDMSRHAKEKNLDAVSLDYIKLTMNCVACHKHARGVRVSALDHHDGVLIAGR